MALARAANNNSSPPIAPYTRGTALGAACPRGHTIAETWCCGLILTTMFFRGVG